MWMQKNTVKKWLDDKKKFDVLKKVEDKSHDWKTSKRVTIRKGTSGLCGHYTSGELVRTLTTVNKMIFDVVDTRIHDYPRHVDAFVKWMEACYKVDTILKKVPELQRVFDSYDAIANKTARLGDDLGGALVALRSGTRVKSPDELIRQMKSMTTDGWFEQPTDMVMQLPVYYHLRVDESKIKSDDFILSAKDIPIIIKLIEEASKVDIDKVVASVQKTFIETNKKLDGVLGSMESSLVDGVSDGWELLEDVVMNDRVEAKLNPLNMWGYTKGEYGVEHENMFIKYVSLLRDSSVIIEHADSWFRSSNAD